MSETSSFSWIFINDAIERFFNEGLPPNASSCVSKMKFRSPINIGKRSQSFVCFWMWSVKEFKVFIWSCSELALYRFISVYLSESTVISEIKILPFLSCVVCSKVTSKSFVKPMITPLELLEPLENNNSPPQSRLHSSSQKEVEWVSCKKAIPLFWSLSFRKLKILRRFSFCWSPLQL